MQTGTALPGGAQGSGQPMAPAQAGGPSPTLGITQDDWVQGVEPGGPGGGYEAPAPAYTAWEFVPFVGTSLNYTDNVYGDTDKKADVFTTFSAGATVRRNGPRLRVAFDYDLDLDLYASTSSQNGFRNTLFGNATAELWRNYLFMDVAASTSPQIVNNNGSQSAGDRNLSSNQTQVSTYEVSPYLRNRFGSFATAELRYTLSQVFYTQTASGSDRVDNQGDETRNAFAANLSAGPEFGRLFWQLDSLWSNDAQQNEPDFEVRNVIASTEYAINRTFTAIGSFGYEENLFNDPLRSDIKGPIWSAGGQIQGARSLLRVTYGERYDGPSYSGTMRYQITQSLQLTGNYVETLQTDGSNFTNQASGLVLAPDGTLIDPVTGLPPDPNDPRFNFQNGVYRDRALDFSLVGNYGRNTIAANVYWDRRDQDPTTDNSSTKGVRFAYNRDLQPDLTAGANVGYSTDDGDDQVSGGPFVNYELNESLTSRFSYLFLIRQQGGDENLLTLSLRKTF